MSSAFLYLAIVAVWAVVLVPMWLRRDTEAPAFSRLLHKRPEEDGADLDLDHDEPAGTEQHQAEHEITAEDESLVEGEPSVEGEPPAEQTSPSVNRRPGRAAVIARRRRRTVGLTLLVLTAVAVSAAGVAPWWIIAPPVLLLAGHLTLLRVAVQMDQARAHEEAEAARAEALRAEAARAEAARVQAEAEPDAEQAVPEDSAEVLEFVGRPEDEVFDQFADDRRAVGE
ncbi:hypothetical protein [Actinomadura gamaensis]|uniref:Uncharacterized protein n=1 Tax=Actinomadura gamaensis TaxID=1763541 RepID=A0ABV9U586_9ACTN